MRVKNAEKFIISALTQWPETRNSDRKLILSVWYLQDPNYENNFRSFFLHKAISPETIRRTRQKFQEQGKYLASEDVEQSRYDKFVNTRHSITHVDGNEVAGVLNG